MLCHKKQKQEYLLNICFKVIIHPFLFSLQVEAPFVPKVRSEDDTSNFDDYDEDPLHVSNMPKCTREFAEFWVLPLSVKCCCFHYTTHIPCYSTETCCENLRVSKTLKRICRISNPSYSRWVFGLQCTSTSILSYSRKLAVNSKFAICHVVQHGSTATWMGEEYKRAPLLD